jgi:hypothetical protein
MDGVTLELILGLCDQLIDAGWQPEPTEELDRRLALHEANPGDVRTWEKVLQRVRGPR